MKVTRSNWAVISLALCLILWEPTLSKAESDGAKSNINKVFAIAQGFGLTARYRDENGIPFGFGKTTGGFFYQIFFEDCDSELRCKTMRLGASWMGRIRAETIDKWNSENQYAKLRVTQDGGFVLESVIGIEAISEKNLSSSFETWGHSLDDFCRKILNGRCA